APPDYPGGAVGAAAYQDSGTQPGPAPGGGDGQAQQPQQPAQQAQPQQPQQQAPASPQAARDAQRAQLRRDHTGPYERFWFRGGPLLWWIKDAPAPGPLVTTSSVASGGIL